MTIVTVLQLITLVLALGIVLSQKLIYSLVCLMGTLLSLSLIFMMYGALYVAASQVIILVGGVMILSLIVVSFFGNEWVQPIRVSSLPLPPRIFQALILVIVLGVALIWGRGISELFVSVKALSLQSTESIKISDLGQALSGKYALFFELITLPLLVALIGGVSLVQKRSHS